MRYPLRHIAVLMAACAGVWTFAGCADDDEVVYVDRPGTIQYVPVQAIEATTYRGAAGYRHPVGGSGLRQLDREYLRTTSPQAPGTAAGYSIPVQAGAGVGLPSPSERPAAPPPAAAAPVPPPPGIGNVAPPVNPPLQSGGIQAPVSTPPAVVPVAPVAPVAPAAPGAIAPLPEPAPAPPPAPAPAPGPGNTLSIQPGAAPPPAPQPLPAPNPNEVQQDPPERPELPGG